MWKVPLSDIDLGQAEIEAVTQVLRSRWLTMGEVTQQFERAFAAAIGVRHALAVANCTVALHMACLALDIGPGDEVILPSLTFVATANAVLYTGATPVFADIASLDDWTISPADIAARITPRTRAIIVMHYGGYPCAMDEILALARRHGLAVIEDAAHAPGATIRTGGAGRTGSPDRTASPSAGPFCGALGDIGCFSFFSNKNLAVGEGGMVTTQRADLAERLRLLRSHGMTTLTWDRHRGHAYSYDVVALGYNYRLDELRAALGLAQLARLAENNRRRAGIVAEYRRGLADLPGLRLPFANHPGESAYHLAPILLPAGRDRLAVIDALRAAGVQTSIHYPPIHLFSLYRQRLGLGEGLLPLTETVASRELTLPLFPTMSEEQVDLVIEAVRAQHSPVESR